MSFVRPDRVLAGFHAEHPVAEVPELVHVGEQWAPPDLPMRPHEHAVWEFYLQAHGVSRWSAGSGDALVLRPRHFLAAPPRTRHGMTARPSARHHFFYAALDLPAAAAGTPELLGPWRPGRRVHVEQAGALEAPFRQLIREVTVARAHQAAGVRAALRLLLVEATRLCGADPGVSLVGAHPGVERVRALLDQHYDRAWSLAELGRAAGLSPNHLVEVFRRDVGVPPHRYLLAARVARGRELLAQTDLPVTAIAVELGFSSSQHFARAFRRLEGRTPGEHRRAQAG